MVVEGRIHRWVRLRRSPSTSLWLVPLPVSGRIGTARRSAYIAPMYQFDIASGAKGDLYRDLLGALDALTADENDAIANMANASALLMQYLPDLNWAGFYRMVGDELVLGPFQGKAACIRIAMGRGVCGTAAASRESQLVADVHAFPGHIACDADSRSELVVPLVVGERLIGVLDLDSPLPGRFDDADRAGCEALVAVLGPRIA